MMTTLHTRLSTLCRLLLIVGAGSGVWGCAMRPDSAPWDSRQSTIPATPPAAMGRLTVETQEAGSPRDGEQPHERFYVYYQSGRFCDYYNNDVFLPIGLPPGQYSVVSRYRGENKKVQVEIREGHSTYVSLEDFRQAPAIE
jgi:hypothetical protein